MTTVTMPTLDDMVERAGPMAGWAGKCHGISMVLVGLLNELNDGPPVATLRRGYFIGEVAKGSYFDGRPSQHSWVELRDGTVLDPTRGAFTLLPFWPIWVGDDEDYDVGGCKCPLIASGDPPDPYDSESAEVELNLESIDYVVGLLGRALDYGDDDGAGWVLVSREQVAWLAHLPVREEERPGVLSRTFAAEVYAAIDDAGYGALIPIDRKDWILPERSGGRAAF